MTDSVLMTKVACTKDSAEMSIDTEVTCSFCPSKWNT